MPYTMPISPIHVGLMHSGKVLVVAGSENDASEHQQQISRAAVWNPQTGTITVQNLQWDVFCNGAACFPDGRFLIVGGSATYDPFYGEPRTTIFDPVTEKFNDVENMAHGRYYATVTELSDGRLLAFSGTDENNAVNKAVEIYRVGSGWSPEYVAPWTPSLYPRLHLLPNGNVFSAGETVYSHMFNPSTHVWTTNVAHTVLNDVRHYGSSVLLPLRPESGYAPRVLIMGGRDPVATATAEIIDLSVATPAWRSVASMSKPRIQQNAVLLPNGKVLVLGGSATNEVASTAILQAELFNPTTETWSPAGVGAYPRLYHSTALLLPDATVWVAGSNPVRGTYEPHMEIYTPAYLFTTNASGGVIAATRPTIPSVPAEIGYGATFAIQTPDAGSISSAVLMRPGAPTHAFDMEQRFVGLSFTNSAPDTLTATAPPNSSIAPPGYYLLFILNNAGVPSVAKFVHLTSTPTNQPPEGTITYPTGDITIQAGQSISFDCSATDPDGPVATYSWIFPEGTPGTSLQQHPGFVTFNDAGIHVVSMTAIDGLGVSDPSPPTRTITVLSPLLYTPFQVWQYNNFTSAELSNSVISGDTADPDGDSIPNLMEYALNLTPTNANTSGLPVATVQNVSTTNYLALTYTRVLSATDISYTVEVSGDLLIWSSGPGFTVAVGAPIDNGDGTQTVTVRDTIPVDSATQRFIRLHINRTPPSPQATLVASSLNPSGPFWIRADVANVPVIHHVDFWVDGSFYHGESIAPYCLFGDDGATPYTGTLPNGAHTIIAKVYSNATTLVATSPPITVTVGPAATLVASSLNPTGPFWVRADVTNVSVIAHVDFWVDGSFYHEESIAPYCLFGDDGANPYTGTLATGAHTITARVYSNQTALVVTSPPVTVTVP